MNCMPHTEPDSAKPTGEPASAVRSPHGDPRRQSASDGGQAVRLNGVRPRTERKGEPRQRSWLGRRGGWGRKGWKCGRDKQGDPCGRERCSWPQGPKSRPMGVRAFVVATKRVTTVERRDAGRWKDEWQNTGRTNQRECPRGLTNGGSHRAQLTWWLPNVWRSSLGTRRKAAPPRRETTDWKAGCARSACPIWREGWRTSAIPTPIKV